MKTHASPIAGQANATHSQPAGGLLGEAVQLSNQRPQAVAQMKLQQMADASNRSRQLSAQQDVVSGGQPRENIVQRRLVVGDSGYRLRDPVVELLQADPDIEWDDDWLGAIDRLMELDEVFTFETTDQLEKCLTHMTMPKASVQQPKSSDDPVGGRLCFVYSALAAAELTNSVEDPEQMQAALLANNRYSSGGGASTAFRQMGIAPEERSTFNTDSDGVPIKVSKDERSVKGKIIEALRDRKPLAVGVRWVSTKAKFGPKHKRAGEFKDGNHWVYAVAIMGNTLYIRDQQSVDHVIGRIDTGTWNGASDDGLYKYTLTKIVAGMPPVEAEAADE
jgi:hypothetical protein